MGTTFVVTKKTGALKATPPEKKLTPKQEEKAETAGYTLPSELSVPADELFAYVTLLFGEKKIGKTSLLSKAPDTFFAMFEPGAKALSVYQDHFPTWARFKSAIAALEKDTKFKLVVVDTVDLAFKRCDAYICKKQSIEHISEPGFGKGYAALRDEFLSTINRLTMTGKGVVLVSHATEKEITMRSGDKYDRIVASMPNMAREIVEGLVDIWVYAGYEGNRRVLHVVGNEHISAGHRLGEAGHFKHPKTGKPIEIIDMGETPQQAYDNFVAAFHNQYTPTTAVAATETPVVKKVKKG